MKAYSLGNHYQKISKSPFWTSHWNFQKLFLIKVNLTSQGSHLEVLFRSRFWVWKGGILIVVENDSQDFHAVVVKVQKIKKRKWICSQCPVKSQGIQIMGTNFHQKTFKGQNCTLQYTFFIWKSKKDGNFCALDLNFSTFWWWLEQIHFSFLNRLGFMVLFFQFYSNCLWPCCALPCSRHYTLLAVVHVIVFWEAAEIFTRWTKICTNFVNVVKLLII